MTTNPPGKRRGRPPGTTSEDTRERILHVARAKFSELGFDNTNYEDIATAAGLSRTALYKHFPTKSDLYRALYRSIQDTVLEEMVAAAAKAGPAFRDRLAAFFSVGARLNTQDPSYARFIATSLVDGLRNPEFAELARAEAERTQTFFRDTVASAVETGELPRTIDQHALVVLLTASLWGFDIYSAFIGDPGHVDTAVGLLQQLLETSQTSSIPPGERATG